MVGLQEVVTQLKNGPPQFFFTSFFSAHGIGLYQEFVVFFCLERINASARSFGGIKDVDKIHNSLFFGKGTDLSHEPGSGAHFGIVYKRILIAAEPHCRNIPHKALTKSGNRVSATWTIAGLSDGSLGPIGLYGALYWFCPLQSLSVGLLKGWWTFPKTLGIHYMQATTRILLVKKDGWLLGIWMEKEHTGRWLCKSKGLQQMRTRLQN